MDEQKYCIKHKLSNGTYLAILNNGWRYDGSIIVEANTEAELKFKLHEARYDDRWVTMEGNHVLIGGNGRIKAGAGGRLNGRKFGMRFKDYESGHVNKKGKRMIRQYSIVGKKNGEKRVIGGTKANGSKQIKKYEEVNSALSKAGFKVDSSFMNKVDKRLAIDNANQLLSLEDKFGVLKNTKVTVKAKENTNVIAAVGVNPTNPAAQNLYFSTNYFHSKDKLVETHKRCQTKDASGKAHHMPCAEGKDTVYTVTHEYGHLLQNMLIAQRFKKDGWKESKPDAFLDLDGAANTASEYFARGYSFAKAQEKGRQVYTKWYNDRFKEVAATCRKEILAIAKKNNRKFKKDDFISKYGKKNDNEFFAEVFANSQLGAPNELGIAMQQWLKQKGLVQNE